MQELTATESTQELPSVFDRRRFPRVSIQAPVLLTDDCCKCEAGHSLDLSRGGLRVLSAARLPEGSIVEIWMELGNGLSLECEAEVASLEENAMGLRFLGMESWQSTQLADFLQLASAA